MSTAIPAAAFQVTDLQRNYREVISAARKEGALLRDKDGLMLVIRPADESAHAEILVEAMANTLRFSSALEETDVVRKPSHYGALAWASVLCEEDQKEFLRELTDQLLVSQNSGSLAELNDLISDWKATALTWADEQRRADLLEPINATGGRVL
jgi:hypothetical protein